MFYVFFIVEYELIPPELLQPQAFHKLKEPLQSKWDAELVAKQLLIQRVQETIALPIRVAPEIKKVYKSK